MGQNGGLFGRIVTAASSAGKDDELVSDVQITIAGQPPARTDQNGQFLITNIPPGTHTVTYSKAGFSSKATEIKIPAQQLADGSIILELAAEVSNPVSSLRGTVTQQSSCRYGPSEYHLYKTGFKAQAPVKIIGRDADGDWLQIELSGRNTPCWINASLVEVEGDVMALPDTYPIDRRLQSSDAFPQLTLISASPGGTGVTASWVHFEIREDLKQTGMVEYIIEVWTCVDGKPAFYAVGTNDTVASFPIDNSCGVASYAHLIGQDEHGFSYPTTIPLP